MGRGKQEENTNGLIWLQHERVYLQQIANIFPYGGVTIVEKNPRRLFPKTKLTHENISKTEKEGKKYAFSNRAFTNKINPLEIVQSKINSPLVESL